MTAPDVQVLAIFMAAIIVFIISFIPECMLIKYDSFVEAPILLKIYVIIHLGIIIGGTLYISMLKPPSIYYFGL